MSFRAALLVLLLVVSTAWADPLPELRLDYATYNPSSLVLKKFGWVEEAFAADGTKVTWLLSQGSNKANELLASASVELASTAGAAALLARTNGVPLRVVYVYSKPEWTALVVAKDSPAKAVTDLRGKRIAVTRGTDPFFFLLRTLRAAGLGPSDVEVVNLQHADGRTALERGTVDAWVGLDPHMAASELQAGSRLLSRNIDFNTFGTLNVREPFLAEHPEAVRRVLGAYERARVWILAHPTEAAALLAEAAKLPPDVATRQLTQRTVLDRDVGVPGDALRRSLAAVVPILRSERLVAPEADPDRALRELITPVVPEQARR